MSGVGLGESDGGQKRSSPSMSDVARRAGVALGTVSNVLNHPRKVAESTRLRVEAAISELAFVPNSSARALAAGVTDIVGVVVVDLGNSLFVEMIRGAEATLTAQGLKTLVGDSDVNQRKQDGYLKTFDEARAAGLLLAPLDGAMDVAHAVRSHGRPVVLVSTPAVDESTCSVLVDEELGGYLAAQHLLEQGARHLAFVGGTSNMRVVTQRLVGVRRAVKGTGARLSVVETGRMGLAEGREVGARLMDREPVVDGVVCASDLLAVGVIEAAIARGRRVPAEMRVIGYDDNHFAAESSLPVSSVRQPGWTMGAEAARLLVEEIRQGATHEHQALTLQPRLVVRESTLGNEVKGVDPFPRPAC